MTKVKAIGHLNYIICSFITFKVQNLGKFWGFEILACTSYYTIAKYYLYNLDRKSVSFLA